MRARRLTVVLALGAAAAAACLTVPVARAQQQGDPQQAVLAVVSPIASTACSLSGSATLLVPIVGGVVEDKVGRQLPVKVADVVLGALGPVYVTCGSLPSPDGRQCKLVDGQIQALWPTQLNGVGLVAPPLGGNAVDALDAGRAVLGLGPQAALEDALQCTVPARTAAPTAPPGLDAGPPPADAAPLVASAPADTGGVAPSPLASAVLGAPIAAVPGATVTTPGVATTVSRTVAEVVAAHVPGPVRLLQLVVALLLAGFLAGSWLTSWRITRAG